MTTVACVLRSGGDFSARWVRRLRAGFAARVPRSFEYRFVCLSDVSIPGVPIVPMKARWPGWWAKMLLWDPSAFREGERVWYFDLDTLFVDALEPLLRYSGSFGMIRGFYRDVPQTGVMSFVPGEETRRLWERFWRDPEAAMARYRGDADWVADQGPHADNLMAKYPGAIVSLKVHARKGPPAGARVVCGHGNPRLSDPAAGWAHEAWLELGRTEAKR